MLQELNHQRNTYLMLLTWSKDEIGEETTTELDAKMKKICERTTYLQICRDVEDTAPSLAVSPLLAPICRRLVAARRGHSSVFSAC